MDKRKELNYRDAGDNRGCAECEHPKKMECPVIDGPIHYDMRCDAWNDKSVENTWHLFAHSINDRLLVLVKEGNCTVAQKEFKLPVKSVENEIIKIFDTTTKALGCPDFVTNLSPKKYKPYMFRTWLDYRCIKYRELEVELDTEKIEAAADLEKFEVLSSMIDAWLRDSKEENHGKHGN